MRLFRQWRAAAGRLCAATLACGLSLASPARAVDVDPGDYTALPAGTNLFLVYEQYIHRDQLATPGGTLRTGTNLDSAVTLFRYVHFMDLGPFRIDPQVIVPVGKLYDARIGGQRLESSGGIGDIVPLVTVWLINRPTGDYPTFLGVSPIVTLPTGTYDRNAAINLGGNRVTYDLQVGLIQGLAPGVLIDLAGDVIWYGKNSSVGATNLTLTQETSYQFQTWLRYAVSPATSLALGYAGYWGGKQMVAGVANGFATDHQQIRASVQTFLDPTTQLETVVGRDVSAEKGFREALRVQLRVIKIF